MEEYEKYLGEIKNGLEAGANIKPVTVRVFLSWFKMQRRSKWNVETIDSELEKRGLITIPDYVDAEVDDPMTFAKKSGAETEQPDIVLEDVPHMEAEVSDKVNKNKFGDDPFYRIGKLKAATRPPLWVPPTALLAEATTKMFTNDFSQLPVMQTPYALKGIVSWKSIGLKTSFGNPGNTVQEFMIPAKEVALSASIFDAMKIIIEDDYVLVRGGRGEICGIVTATDLCVEFERISKPFLLISEIEINIRNIIENSIRMQDLEEFFCKTSSNNERKETNSDKLTFGDYIKILQDEKNWDRLRLKMDRKSFCEDLDVVRSIRNSVMHFASDATSLSDLEKIKSISRMIDKLRAFEEC